MGACVWLCGALLLPLGGGCATGPCLCCSSCIDTEMGADALLLGAAPHTTLGGCDGAAPPIAAPPCVPCSS